MKQLFYYGQELIPAAIFSEFRDLILNTYSLYKDQTIEEVGFKSEGVRYRLRFEVFSDRLLVVLKVLEYKSFRMN